MPMSTSKKLLMILAMAVSAALIAAGCGDDDSTSSTSADTTTAETGTTAIDDTPTTEGTDAASAEEACKAAVDAQNVPISDEVRAEIEQICQDASDSTDPAELQAASQRVCELVINDNLPPGSARDQALKSCEAIGQ